MLKHEISYNAIYFLLYFQTFWDASMTQIGWNGAHNSHPHVTLVAGLAVPDDKVDNFVDIVKQIWHKFHPDLKKLSEITFEKYESPNFLGYFVGKEEEILLRLKKFVQTFVLPIPWVF